MKQYLRQFSAFALICLLLVFSSGSAVAEPVMYSTEHVFSIDDIQGDGTGDYYGTDCLDMDNTVSFKNDELEYYAIDSGYGMHAEDYNFELSGTFRPVDGTYEEGWVANLYDDDDIIGLKVRTPATPNWKTGPLRGNLLYVDGDFVKSSTENYVVMDHVLGILQDNPLVEGIDYGTIIKDDGKILYIWGDMSKAPTEVRLYANLPLPDVWEDSDTGYEVTSAKLIIQHPITNTPNDQIRPEDFENENAIGILPQYEILEDGSWVSTVDSFEGDGHEIFAGTVLRDSDGEYTNAWYTTLDRDPFGGDSPRWRLQSSKYGQDIPGVPIEGYTAGDQTTTTIDLLANMTDEITGEIIPSLLRNSNNWFDHRDADDGIIDGLSPEGVKLTEDFDLSVYIKGEYIGQEIHNAKLVLEYEDPDATNPPTYVDVKVEELEVPDEVLLNSVDDISIDVMNNHDGEATGNLALIGKDKKGNIVGEFYSEFTTPDDQSTVTIDFEWTAPSKKTPVTWTATVLVEDDYNPDNDMATGTTIVVK